jgi:hypothetical protein
MGKLIEPVVERWAAEPLADLLARNAGQLERVLEASALGSSASVSCQASAASAEACAKTLGGLATAGELSKVSQ